MNTRNRLSVVELVGRGSLAVSTSGLWEPEISCPGCPSSRKFSARAAAAAREVAMSAQSAAAESGGWRTDARQPTLFKDESRKMPFHLVLAYAPFRGAKSRQHKRAHSHDASGYAHSGWATRDAAEAAKSHFKAWVDGERHARRLAGWRGGIGSGAQRRIFRRQCAG